MGILSALFLGITSLGISAHSENKSRNRINSHMEGRIADGFERAQNKELEEQYYRELITLWSRSVSEKDPTLFYPEKHDFFLWNPQFARDWAWSVASERVIQDGYSPSWVAGPFSMARDGNHAWYRWSGGFKAEEEYYKSQKVFNETNKY